MAIRRNTFWRAAGGFLPAAALLSACANAGSTSALDAPLAAEAIEPAQSAVNDGPSATATALGAMPAAFPAAGAPAPAVVDDGVSPAGVAERAAAGAHERALRRSQYAAAMSDAAERQLVFASAEAPETNSGASQSDAAAEPAALERVRLDGVLAQGGLIFGETTPGATITLDGDPVMVGADGRFVFGFGRDSALSALLVATLPDGSVERRALEIEDREFKVERIDGLDQSKVSRFTEEQLVQIRADQAKKKAARVETQPTADWAVGFDWPLLGRISGVFGSQRILNGEAKRPHSGVDVAAPTGTPIRAPAPGIVRLAAQDMYFEGGLVLIDHGHWLESAFLHLSRLDVTPGQRVEKGDVIGAVGATGRATGPHLHWSVKWTGRLVDPQLLVGEMPDSQ